MIKDILENYRLTYDHHTHTTFTHGKSSVEDNVKEAVKKGLKSIAITEHGPGHITYGIAQDDIEVLRSEIIRLRPLYPEIEILFGLEMNTVKSEPYVDCTPELIDSLDIRLLGYHFGMFDSNCIKNTFWNITHKNGLMYKEYEEGVFQADFSKLLVSNTEMMLNAIENNRIDIVTHVGDKGPFDVVDIAKLCAKKGVMMEINSHHGHLNVNELKIAAREDVRFVLSSDAHIASDVGNIEDALNTALLAGIDLERIDNLEKK